ncbi:MULTISPECIES: sensor histidine kinase [unclassified Lentimicrobium]|uniref:sensor histidine kinase n=1 Tax=unclassified Lentimicrobium TaxID=2677434 RepID=UPI0015568256|nr:MULTISPECIES: histidine kinase [unclassified Lentimicrobium]NPD47453.1 histidine kinase [Lentimicrobium sp. S6]NPD85470.1 histidine kinase [Lentimicrobium sp. L6]
MTKVWDIKRILEHLLFWMVYWLMISFFQGLYDLDFVKILLSSLMNLPLTIVSTYFFIYFILPLIYKKKLILFLIFSILLLATSVILRRILIAYIQFPLFFADSGYTFVFLDWYRIGGHFVQNIEVIGIVSAIKYYRDWNRNRNKIDALTKEKKEAELNFLKAQVHPHFLFNTLNSIYYEVLKKSDKAAALVIQLSELLRFTLYECKDDFILLDKELKIIENYIEIEKSRYGERLLVNFSYDRKPNIMIPPLIIFSLIENSFKHGVSEQKGVNQIDISIAVKSDNIRLHIRNPISRNTKKDSLGASEGIGLENTIKQLDIIYDSRYVLDSSIVDHNYNCILEIPISVK